MKNPQRSRSLYSFDALHTDAELEAFEGEWAELFGRSRTHDPFVHPAWALPWLRHYVPDPGDRLVIAVRRERELVGLAPLYVHCYGFGPLRCRTLQLVGSGPRATDHLTEMSEILVLPEDRRRILRALLHHLSLEIGGWDWLALTLPARQGWFEHEWLPNAWRRRGANIVHKAVRTFVVLRLPGCWSDLPLKRNLKEALRKSSERLEAEGTVEISFAEGDDVPGAIGTLIALHRQRASVIDHLRHDDYFGHGSAEGFARAAAAGMAAYDSAAVSVLRLDGEPIAGRLLLGVNRGVFFSFSGLEPRHWRLGASAALTAAAIRRAIEHGDKRVNFSSSPDSGKLRWSEQLDFQHEFLVVAPSRHSRLLFSLWWQHRARRLLVGSRRLVVDQLAPRLSERPRPDTR
jgi:CelD/BcsL family acetyltransferase involved in cellulose biosynthesis